MELVRRSPIAGSRPASGRDRGAAAARPRASGFAAVRREDLDVGITSRYEPGLRVAAADHRRGFLLRFPSTSVFFWGEVSSGSSQPLVLRRFKTLEARAEEQPLHWLLFLPSEDTPRAASEESVFRRVPLEPALLCAVHPAATKCVEVGEAVSEVAVPGVVFDGVRVIRAEPVQPEDQYEVLARGRVTVVPRKVAVQVLRAAPWVAIEVQDPKEGWNDVVVQRSASGLAAERLEGRLLSQLPASTPLHSRTAHGARVRAVVGRDKRSVDSDAQLVAFPVTDGKVSPIPLMTARVDAGEFDFAAMGSGDYEFKLLSAAATGRPARAAVTAGVPVKLEFAAGPVVRGRLVRSVGGTPDDIPTVEITADLTWREALAAGDLSDRVRVAKPDDAGRFAIVAPSEGKYRLTARWGLGRATRTFAIDDETDVELGEVALQIGSTLRGTVSGCGGGEAVVIPTPEQLSKQMTSGLSEIRRSPIGEDGAFIVEGLGQGSFSVIANCGGTMQQLSPHNVLLGDVGDTVVDFKIAKPLAP